MADAIRPKAAIPISASLNVEDAKVLARSTETIPDTAYRVDQRISLLLVDLAPHASDIDIDYVCRWIEVEIPDVLQQHCPGYHPPLVAHEVFQELEFPRKEHDLLAVPAGRPRDQVDRKIADAQDGLLGNGVAASSKRLEPRKKFHERKRFYQIVVTAGAQTAYPVVDLPECTNDQERRADAAIAQSAHYGNSVDVRKHTVDRDDGIVARRAPTQRFMACRSQVDLVAARRELFQKLAGSFRVVLDDKNTTVTSHHGLHSPNHRPKGEPARPKSEIDQLTSSSDTNSKRRRPIRKCA